MVPGSGAEARMQGIGQVLEREGFGHPSIRKLGMEPLWIHSGCANPVVRGVSLGRLVVSPGPSNPVAFSDETGRKTRTGPA